MGAVTLTHSLKNLATRAALFFAVTLSTSCQTRAFHADAKESINSAAVFKSALPENMVKGTVYRFWSQYESERRTPNDHLELFIDEGLQVNSLGAVAQSHQDVLTFLNALPVKQRNAHSLESIEVTADDEQNYRYQATAVYQMVSPEGVLSSANLAYEATLVRGAGEPVAKFKTLKISPIKALETKEFHDRYQENRIRALVHHWFAQFDRNDRDLKSILGFLVNDNLEMNFPSGTLTTKTQVAEFVTSIGKTFKETAHHVNSIDFKPLSDDTYEVLVSLQFQGVDVSGAFQEFPVNHRWIVRDNHATKYPLIQKYSVSTVVLSQPE